MVVAQYSCNAIAAATVLGCVLNHCSSDLIKTRRYAAKLVVLVKLSGLRDDARVEGFHSGNFRGKGSFFCR